MSRSSPPRPPCLLVGPARHPERMLSILIAGLVMAGTALQTFTSAKDSGDAHRPAMNEWTAEDDLIAELRPWRRRAARRELEAMRDDETAKSISHVKKVLVSWAMLSVAAVLALSIAVVKFAQDPSWL